MDNSEMIKMLFTALITSVELEMDDFNDDLDKAKDALKSLSKAAHELHESLGSRGAERVGARSFKSIYAPDNEIDRVKLFNDAELLQVNTRALVDAFRQYLRNNIALLASTGTKLELRIVGNPLLPEIVIRGGYDSEETD